MLLNRNLFFSANLSHQFDIRPDTENLKSREKFFSPTSSLPLLRVNILKVLFSLY